MLTPKKAREFIKPTAEELDADILLADDFIQFYWEHVRKALEEPKHCNIDVRRLGIFKVFRKKLNLFSSSLNNGSEDTEKNKRKLEYIKKINHFIMEESNKKNTIKSKKDEIQHWSNNKKNLV